MKVFELINLLATHPGETEVSDIPEVVAALTPPPVAPVDPVP